VAGGFTLPGVGLNQVRIAYVLKKEDLIKAVKILKETIVATMQNNIFSTILQC
jgi:aspartate aminotransferase